MFSHRPVSGALLTWLNTLCMIALAGPAGAAPALASGPAEPAASLLQFSSGGHALGFSSEGLYAATGTHALHVDFIGANSAMPQADSPALSNGQAAPLGRVTYADLWDGITLTFTAAGGGIYTTTYTLAPGADVQAIRLRYNRPITLNQDGTLSIAFETGSLTESAPLAWQDIGGARLAVDVCFHVHGQEVSFVLGTYDAGFPLMIDPTLAWNTFLGASGPGNYDEVFGIAVDGSGNIYVAGESDTTWGAPVRAHYAGTNKDAFAAKLNSSGALTWNTFLGDSGIDSRAYVAVDGSGNVYVTGRSTATWGSPVNAHAMGVNPDAFAARLDSSGALTWNTFLGGVAPDFGNGIGVDGSGNVYVGGYSGGTWGAPVTAYTSGGDAFAAKLTSAGALTWNTFMGGAGLDIGRAMTVDSSGNVCVTGDSDADWGNPVRDHDLGANQDAFAARLDSAGGLTWNTFLGGAGADQGWGIAMDGIGHFYVTGLSTATWGSSPERAYTSGDDAFAARLNSIGELVWNTFLGGTASDFTYGIAVDGDGNVYVGGYSDGTWGAPVRAYTSAGDAVAAQLDSSGALIWNSFLGGSGTDVGFAIAVDGSGQPHVAGRSSATWETPVRPYSSGEDGFVAKLGFMLTFKSQGANDGWVLESTETSGMGGSNDSIATTLRVGDDATDKQYRSIVSFNTASLPDNAVITKVTLKVKKQGLTGTDPFTTHGTLMAAIRKPYFGSAVTLANSDFQAALSKQVGFSSVPVSNWYSTNNNPVIWPYINLTGTTQFRLRFTLDDNDDMGADYVRFYSGNAGAAYRPQLIVEYYVP